MNRTGLRNCVVAVVLAAGCLCSINAAAQNGGCVNNKQQIGPIQCQGGCTKTGCSCHGSITITEPASPFPGQGQITPTLDAFCCSTKFSTLGAGEGSCTIFSWMPRIAANESHLVLVRGCDGRYRLYSVVG